MLSQAALVDASDPLVPLPPLEPAVAPSPALPVPVAPVSAPPPAASPLAVVPFACPAAFFGLVGPVACAVVLMSAPA